MAKGKPNLAFLEALNRDKRRRGDPAPGGVFKTPEWFNKSKPTPAPAPARPQSKGTAASAIGSTVSARGKGFHLTTTQIAGGVMALLIVVMGGYITFRKQAPPKLSAGIETVRSAPPAQASVMDVSAGRSAAVTPPAPVPAAATVASSASNATTQASAGNSVLATGPRTVSVYYVVFHIDKKEDGAIEAKNALVAGGVGATVEKGCPGYGPTWYVVMGTQGFVKTNTADYLQYLNKCKAISEKFAGKSKWKQFEPNPYKWR